MSKSDIYYGPLDVPKGKRRPTMKEAVEANQVRYYGINKVDNILVHAKGNEKKIRKDDKKKLEKAEESYISNAVKLKKIKDKIVQTKSTAEKNDLVEDEKKLLKDKMMITELIKKYKPSKDTELNNMVAKHKQEKHIQKKPKQIDTEALELKKQIELLNDEKLKKSVLKNSKKSISEKPKKVNKEELELNKKIKKYLDKKDIFEKELKQKELKHGALTEKDIRDVKFVTGLEIHLRILSYLSNPDSLSTQSEFKLPDHEFKKSKEHKKIYEDLLSEKKKLLLIERQNIIKQHIAEYEKNDNLYKKIEKILSDNNDKLNKVKQKLDEVNQEYHIFIFFNNT